MSGSEASGAELLNIHDYRDAARTRLEKATYDYYAGGAFDEITVHDNHRAYERLRLRYRVLRDVSRRRCGTTTLGARVEMPILVAPTAFHALAHPEGEVATVRAAGRCGTIMIVSTLSNRSIEEIAGAATSPIWFQLYVYRDREATRALIERAEAAGCEALVLTVDAQVWGERERDTRNRFQLPDGLAISNLSAGGGGFPAEVSGSGLAAFVDEMFDPSLSWKDLEWLRSITDLPIVVKGIVHFEDARLAVDHGAAGVIVSNHGGRQVDTAPAPIEVLASICDAVGDRAEVHVDGGIQRGSDVVKALALGARAVAVGRPVLWGLAVGGQEGVEQVLEILRREFDAVMGLCGATRPEELTPDLILEAP